MVGDPVGDFITRLKNAQHSGHARVAVPYSRLKHDIANALIDAGYVKSAVKKGKKVKKILEVELVYENERPILRDAKRVSKPSRRIYRGTRELKRSAASRGTTFLSTPKGILPVAKALDERVGGEVMFTLY